MSDESGRKNEVARKMVANPRRDCCAQDRTATTIAVSESVAWGAVRCRSGEGGGGDARAGGEKMRVDGVVVVVVGDV